MLPHPGFVTLEADPPNVILLPPTPLDLTGESLALLICALFSLLPSPLPRLPAEKTRFARPGDAVIVPRRLVPRSAPASLLDKSPCEALERRRVFPLGNSESGESLVMMEDELEMNESSCRAPNSVTNCGTDDTPEFLRIPPVPKVVDLVFRRGRGRIGRVAVRVMGRGGGGMVKLSSPSDVSCGPSPNGATGEGMGVRFWNWNSWGGSSVHRTFFFSFFGVFRFVPTARFGVVTLNLRGERRGEARTGDPSN
jgi:hypothetical protein